MRLGRRSRPGKSSTAGPFYLVWLRPERGGISPEQWPYQVVKIESVLPLARRFPMVAPAAGVSARDPIRHGFAVYEKNCSVCHTINLGGDASIGPDLNVPYNPTEYLRVDALRRLIRDPQTLRRWPAAKMPAFPLQQLSDRDLTDLLAYLHHMADRKVAGAGSQVASAGATIPLHFCESASSRHLPIAEVLDADP